MGVCCLSALMLLTGKRFRLVTCPRYLYTKRWNVVYFSECFVFNHDSVLDTSHAPNYIHIVLTVRPSCRMRVGYERPFSRLE